MSFPGHCKRCAFVAGLLQENTKLLEEKRELERLFAKDKEILEKKVGGLETQLEEQREDFERQMEGQKVREEERSWNDETTRENVPALSFVITMILFQEVIEDLENQIEALDKKVKVNTQFMEVREQVCVIANRNLLLPSCMSAVKIFGYLCHTHNRNKRWSESKRGKSFSRNLVNCRLLSRRKKRKKIRNIGYNERYVSFLFIQWSLLHELSFFRSCASIAFHPHFRQIIYDFCSIGVHLVSFECQSHLV